MTAERRTARIAARALSLRSSGPAAAIAAVSSAALVGAAVFGFGGTGLGVNGAQITGDVPRVPDAVQAIGEPAPSVTKNPFVRRPSARPTGGVGVVPVSGGSGASTGSGVFTPGSGGGPVLPTSGPGTVSRPPVTTPTSPGHSSRPPTSKPPTRPTTKPTTPPGKPTKPPTKPPTTTPTPPPTKQPPSSIVVAFSKQQVEKSSDAVRTRVSTSLSVLAGPGHSNQAVVKKVSKRLDQTLDGAVTTAMNDAANTALCDAVDATRANASEGQIRLVAAASFKTALPMALMAQVKPVVSEAVDSLVPGSGSSPELALISDSAALKASPVVAEQSTDTVVDAVTDSVTDTDSSSGDRASAPSSSTTSSPTSPTSSSSPTTTTTTTKATSAAPSPTSTTTTSSTSSTASPTRSDDSGTKAGVAADTASPTASTTTQDAGRRAPARNGSSRGDGDKVRPQSRADADKRRASKPNAKKTGPERVVRTKAGRRSGAHLASHDDEPRRRAPGRHRA